MLYLFSLAQDPIINKSVAVAKEKGINETVVWCAEASSRILLQGLQEAPGVIATMVTNDVSSEKGEALANKLNHYLSDENYESPKFASSMLSNAVGTLAYYGVGGGILGVAACQVVSKGLEPIFRKMQYVNTVHKYEELDRTVEAQAQRDYEDYGYSGCSLR